jgi:hypothetical protein
MKPILFISAFLLGTFLLENVFAQNPTVSFNYDAAGNRTERYITVEKSIEVDSLFQDEQFPELIYHELDARVYPNPTYGLINIETGSDEVLPVKYVIVDQTGKTLQVNRLIDQYSTIDLTSFEPGIYFIQLQGNDRRVSYKIVKK